MAAIAFSHLTGSHFISFLSLKACSHNVALVVLELAMQTALASNPESPTSVSCMLGLKTHATLPAPTSFLNYFVCRVLCGSLKLNVGLCWLCVLLYDYRLDQDWEHLQQKAPLTLAIGPPHSQVTLALTGLLAVSLGWTST